MTDYADMPGLSDLYLEDSYVLDIAEGAGELTFSMSAVLTPEHPAYRDPLPGEQYCYAHGALVFSEVARIDWLERSTQRYVDATGELDLGNIDSLTSTDGTYELAGDWGRVRIRCAGPPRFTLREAGAVTPKECDVVWRRISDEEAAVVTAVVSALPGFAGLLDGLDRSFVSRSPVWILDIRAPGDSPGVDVPDGPLPVRAFVQNGAGYRGEILVWVQGGRLSGLEYAWVTDDPPTRWPRPDEIGVVGR